MTPHARATLAVATIGACAAAIAAILFPRAFPAIALDNRLTQATALARADSFFSAHALAPDATRRAVLFAADDSVVTYVDIAAGGADSVNALVRGKDAALFSWAVRAFEPGDAREATVELATDGRVIGFRRKLANTDTLPDIGADSASALAYAVLTEWIGQPHSLWQIQTTSYETRKESGRVDRTVTFERTDRTIGDAPIRLDVVVAGNTPVEARPYIYIPESFSRRYAEMRSANDLLAALATVGILGLALLGVLSLRRFSRDGGLRWKPALLVGGVIGAGIAGAGINGLGAAWFSYDTATPAALHQAIALAAALAGGVAMGGVVTLTLVAAEAAARHAFPHKLDWWALWRARGTREAAAQVGGGYVVAAIGFAYVAAFYLVTRHTLGWWVPSELLDDPNQVATPAPWLTGIAMSLQAGVWEEALFRALPLSMLALWTMNRPNREWWMRMGIVGTALIFGFAHSNYPSWPPYSRGFELLLEASFWGVVFLRAGLLVTVTSHFVYDLVLFSLFTATGSAPAYRISAAIALLALLAPALVVGWRLLRQRGFAPLPAGARFGEWRQPPGSVPPAAPEAIEQPRALSAQGRSVALVAFAAALVAAAALPAARVRGPAFTATRERAMTVADSMLAASGSAAADSALAAVRDPASGWRRLATAAADTLASWPRLLHEHGMDYMVAPLAFTYSPPAWWTVRYVRTTGSASDRADEWRIRVTPDGRPLDARHIVADSAPGGSPPADSLRRAARRALARAGVDTTPLVESDFQETERPRRRDATVTYVDTSLHLPEGASARAWVSFAGSEPLVSRRGIELPESFRRAERERGTRVLAFTGLLAALALGVIGGGAIVIAKRRRPLVNDAVFDRRTALRLLGLLALLSCLVTLNNWPAAVFAYDTAATWSSHLATFAIAVVVAPIGVLVIAGVWQVMEVLRRRAGIAAWPTGGRDAVRSATIAGMGIGAVAVLGELVSQAMRAGEAGLVPVTGLSMAVPAVAAALAMPAAIGAVAAASAVPPLLLMATTRSARVRWLVFLLAIVVAGAVLAPIADSVASELPSVGEALAGLCAAVALVAAIVVWGRRGPLTWLVAAATFAGLSLFRDGVDAHTGQERIAAALGVLACVACALWLARRAAARQGTVVDAGDATGAPDQPMK
ncbi:MAG: CPBP family intramembrane metalloprotease [Gemmatimonadaceae bacterium]|nr:CPBP family intramembrane metalloprotease [Gemmatimonadaceae bacterium]